MRKRNHRNNFRNNNFREIRSYLDGRTWRRNENANFNFSHSGLLAHVANQRLANYALSRLPKRIRKAHTNGAFHIHNLESGMLCGYCHGGSLTRVLTDGVRSADISSKPAKHLDTIVDHIVNYIFMSQLEWAGAQSLSDFDTLLAPFIYYDKLSYKKVKQSIQRLVYNLNFASRQAFQSPFSNLTFNLSCPKNFENMNVIIGGKPQKETYSDFPKEINMINKAFVEVLMERDSEGRPFTFPIPTLNLTKRIDWNSPIIRAILKETSILGSYYYMNYCLAPNTKVIVKRNNKIYRQPIAQIKAGDSIESPNGFICVKNVFHRQYDGQLIRIKLKNGHYVECTEDHVFPTLNGDVEAKTLKTGDLIEISNYLFEASVGTYSAGKMIGLYMAEGWKNKTQVYFSNKDKTVIDFIDDFTSKLGSQNWVQTKEDGVTIIVCNSNGVSGIIDDYCLGNNAKNKRFKNKIFNTSNSFRRGIIDGWFIGDGSKREPEGFSSSSRLILDMAEVLHSIGEFTSIHIKNNNQHNFNCHHLRILSQRRSTKLVRRYNKVYCRVDTITKGKGLPQFVVDIQLDSPEHIFTLANGIVTHNCGSGINEDSVRAMCCRLNLNLDELSSARGAWNMGSGTGSLGVVSINMGQLGYLNKGKGLSRLLENLQSLMVLAKKQLLIKRELINQSLERGYLPFAKFYGLNLDHYFLTIGVIGLNEMCMNFVGSPLSQNPKLVASVLKFMREQLREFQQETEYLFNLEMSPAEGSSYRLALVDKRQFSNIFTLGTKNEPYYTSLLIPPSEEELNLFDRIKIEEQLLPKFSGGTTFRVYLGEVPDIDSLKSLLQKISSTHIPYFDVTATFSVCSKDGKMFNGIQETCSSCGAPTDVYSRVVGYYRKTSKWNRGKQQEFSDRRYINIQNS